MSSFFTLPASQKKRKRSQPGSTARAPAKKKSALGKVRDDSISGSDVSEGEEESSERGEDPEGSGDEDDDDPDEDPAAKRLRLAEQYIANTEREVLEDVGFDAAEIDAENLRSRMGERLKEDTAESKGKIYRWIAEDFQWSRAARAQFRHHQSSVTGVAISGDYAYTVGKDSTLAKWRLPQAVRENGHGNPTRARKPEKVLASRPPGKPTGAMDSHRGPILCVAASQDGRFVATGGADKKLVIWDASTLRPLKVFGQHRDAVISLAFRRGTNELFSASKDRTIKIWSLDELTYVETLFGHQDEVVDVSALAQEKCVSVGARDRTARLWKVVEESQLVYRGGGGAGRSKPVHRGNGGQDTVDPTNVIYHEGSIDRVVCIDDEHFVTGSDNGALSLWNINKKKAVYTLPLAHGIDIPLPLGAVSAEQEPDEEARPKPQPRWITALTGIPFSDVFVSGSWDGYVRAWKVSPDKRRIEPLGRVGCIDETVDSLLLREGLSADALSTEALRALREGAETQGRADGCVNDLAIIDRGTRAGRNVVVVAAIGKQPRLGRWRVFEGGKNYCVLFEVSRREDDDSQSEQTEKGLSDEHEVNGDFAGFD